MVQSLRRLRRTGVYITKPLKGKEIGAEGQNGIRGNQMSIRMTLRIPLPPPYEEILVTLLHGGVQPSPRTCSNLR